MTHKSSGSALLATLLFLGVICVLAQKLVQSSLLTSRMLSEQISATEAKILALNGLTLAFTQLSVENQSNKKQPPEDIKKNFLLRILPTLNRWQTFKLSNELDGMNGTIKICISCEEGKFPIHDLIDSKSKTLNKAYLPLLKNFEELTSKKNSGILTRITQFLQKQTTPLEDPTQLNSAFQQSLFFDPTRPLVTNKKQLPPPPQLPWLDLFSCWNPTNKINPLFLSNSACLVLKLKNPFNKPIDDKDEKDIYPRIAETISKGWGTDWKKNWSTLSPLYGVEPQMPAEMTPLLSEAVEPSVFSVLSCGTVRGIEQRLYAIVHKKKLPESTEKKSTNPPGEAKQQADTGIQTCISPENTCGIVRMYWIDKFNNYDNQTVGLNT